MPNTNKPKLDKILAWKTAKPSTNNDWAEDVKKESLHLKFYKQLKEMKQSLQDKLPQVEKDLDKFNRFPDAIRYELNEQVSEEGFDLEGKTKEQCLTIIDNQSKDEYFITNPRFMNPKTLFRPQNFDNYLNNTPHPLQGKVSDVTRSNIESFKKWEPPK